MGKSCCIEDGLGGKPEISNAPFDSSILLWSVRLKDKLIFHAIPTKEQFADIFTKPLDASTFLYLREKYLKW